MTHVVTLMQALWLSEGWPLLSVGALLGILVVGGAMFARLFRWK